MTATTTESALDVDAIVHAAADLLAEHYVFPDVAARLADLLRRQSAAGRYRGAESAEALGRLVTDDLQAVNQDRHLRLKFHVDPLPTDTEDDDAAWHAIYVEQAAGAMGGVRGVERLSGNVGLLELAPMLFPADIAGPSITAAMQLLHAVDALIIDLREMRGGDPGTVALICSYLLLEPTHLNTMRARDEQKTTQSWTLPYVPGPRIDPGTPVWVLTSATTFSGGEELTYDLQQLGRAMVVGETTGGGAHAREGFPVHPHLELTVPVVRAVNPVSGTNWEGVGVCPDVAVPAALALETAHGLALDHLAGRADLSAALRREVGTLRGRAD